MTQAAVCRAFNAPLSIETITLAAPSEQQVLIDVKACAICHSDLAFMRGDWQGPLPSVYGHEASGVVKQCGKGVSGIEVGDHVILSLIRRCGQCQYCHNEASYLCNGVFDSDSQTLLHDASGQALHQGLNCGAFAEQALVDASQLQVIPPDLSFEAASLLACGVITGAGAVVNTAKVRAGSRLAVIGCGGVGLNCLQGAHLSAAAQIIAIDINPDKLLTATEFGATDTINSQNTDVLETIKALTQGHMLDYVFVSVGIASAIVLGQTLISPGGEVVIVGIPPNDTHVSYDAVSVSSGAQTIRGSKMGSTELARDIPRWISLYQQDLLKLDELVSQTYPLAHINEAIAASQSGCALRNVITMNR